MNDTERKQTYDDLLALDYKAAIRQLVGREIVIEWSPSEKRFRERTLDNMCRENARHLRNGGLVGDFIPVDHIDESDDTDKAETVAASKILGVI